MFQREFGRGEAQRVLAAVICAAVLSGCEAMAITAMGVGASAGVTQTLNGIAYRTFTAPAPQVKVAAMAALRKMGIRVQRTEKVDGAEVIKANASDREIELELESLSPNTTRLRATARKGPIFYDSATATEIILQTEKLLGNS